MGGVGGLGVEVGGLARPALNSARVILEVGGAGGSEGEAAEGAGGRVEGRPGGYSGISPSLSSSSSLRGGGGASALGGGWRFINMESLGLLFCGGLFACSTAGAFGGGERVLSCISSPSSSASSCSAAVLGFDFFGIECANGAPSGEDAEVDGMDDGRGDPFCG